ncbi:MAG: type II toxin-antitoxin system VapC family toxin [Dehalococcoidia bacterium]
MASGVVDSDVLIDVLRNAAGAAERLAALSLEYDLATTSVSVFEIVRASQNEQDERKFFQLIDDFAIWPFDHAAALTASEAWRQTRAAGTPVDTGDLLIAGIALARDAVVITRNRRDFERIPNLTTVSV